MATYWPTERRELSRAMRRMQRDRDPGVPHVGCADANSVCASCGMTLVDSPFQTRDYFDLIMRVGRPLRVRRGFAAQDSALAVGLPGHTREQQQMPRRRTARGRV